MFYTESRASVLAVTPQLLMVNENVVVEADFSTTPVEITIVIIIRSISFNKKEERKEEGSRV